MGARDEQKEQRRQLIIFKATELFVKNGYADTKISDIAKAANMSVGLLFHYFESKEKLFEELVKLGVSFSSRPKQISIENPIDYFRMSINGIFMAAGENPFVLYMFVLMNQARSGGNVPQYIKEIAMSVDQMEYSTKIITEGQKQGCIKKGDPKLLSFTLWSAVQGVMEQIAMNIEQFSADGDYPDTEWLLDIIKNNNESEKEK